MLNICASYIVLLIGKFLLHSEGREGVDGQDLRQAMELFEKSCYLDNSHGCFDLGLIYFTGNSETEQDYQEAKQLFEKSCNLRDGSGCYAAGTIYYRGNGVDPDLRQAKHYYGKSCHLGDLEGCDMFNRLKDSMEG